jgi:cell division protein FtsB
LGLPYFSTEPIISGGWLFVNPDLIKIAMKFVKRFFPILVILLLLLIIKNNIYAIFASLSNSKSTNNLTQELNQKKKEHEYLTEQLKYVKTDQFVEDQAQNKLGLLRPGEYFVIAPTVAPSDDKTQTIDDRPNWERWWDLFF